MATHIKSTVGAVPPSGFGKMIGFAYSVLVAVIILIYLSAGWNQYFDNLHFGFFKDVITFGILVFLSLVALGLGASPYAVLAPAAIGSLVVLTIEQEPLIRYLTLAAILFCIGMYGMVVSRNAVRVLMSIELMLNAVNINLVAFSRYIDPHATGQIFAIFILTVAAAEAAVGIGIVLAIYRNTSSVDMEKFNLLKW
jgi:NAD(P)H-quinone oxidoreductase subunit 4L